MTSVFTARRRAEEFHSLVEQDSAGTAPPARLAECVDLVRELRDLPSPEPRPEFSAALREELLAAADTLLVHSDDSQRLALPARTRARDRRLAAAVGGIAIVGATSSLAVAAQSALPGDVLYPLKRALESAETGIHTSDTGRATSLLADATDRLDEAAELSRTGDLGDGAYVAQSLVDFADQAGQGSELLLDDYAETGDEESVEALRDFTAASMDSLAQLEAQLPEEARDELRYAAQVLADIDAAAERACPQCRGGIDRIPAVLAAAGQRSEPETIVVPGDLLPDLATTKGSDGRGGKGDGTRDGGGGGSSSSSDDPSSVWEDIKTAPSPSGSGGTGNGDDTSGPVEDLADGLAGGAPTSNDGLTGIPEVDDTVDDVVEGVDEVLPDLP